MEWEEHCPNQELCTGLKDKVYQDTEQTFKEMELIMEKRTDLEERSMKNLRITGIPTKGKETEGWESWRKTWLQFDNVPGKTEKTYLGMSW